MKSAFVLAIALVLAGAPGARADSIHFNAEIDGLQETPPVATPASGHGDFVLDTDANTLSYNITFDGLIGSETAAHIHGPADPGVPAGVKHPLPAGSPKIGVWNYDEADEADILAGRMYVNIHSTFKPGGEIRGQILKGNPTVLDPRTWGGIKALFE